MSETESQPSQESAGSPPAEVPQYPAEAPQYVPEAPKSEDQNDNPSDA